MKLFLLACFDIPVYAETRVLCGIIIKIGKNSKIIKFNL